MNNILLHTEFLPPISTMKMIAKCSLCIIENWENYQKKSTRNRALILSPNGVLKLSVPLKKGKNSKTPIHQVQIAYDENWVANHLHTIRTCYNSAPYYIHYIDEITAIFQTKYEYLIDLNMALLEFLMRQIDIETPIEKTSTYEKTTSQEVTDLRNSSLKEYHMSNYEYRKYHQVFEEKFEFEPNLSALDLLMCTGPESILYL